MNKTINYRKRFKFKQDNLDYTFQIRKRNLKWLWLLLPLLLLLLFVRCDREIAVTTVDKTSGQPIAGADVTICYTSHYLYKDGRFLNSERHEQSLKTDDNGEGTFTGLGCSVFSYIFHCLSKATFTASDDCNTADPYSQSCLFHYTRNKTITLSPKLTPLSMEVIDKETKDPLADAKVVYEYSLGGEVKTDSARSDAAGLLEIKEAPLCGSVTFRSVTCYGYEDISGLERSVADILNLPDSAIIAMTPMKQSFTYFVKNKFTKQPVPGATVNVTLSSKNGQVIRGKSTTNVDGKGRGAYQDAFILAKVELKASKTNYKDGFLEGDYTVEQFAKLPDSLRVVYLEPEPYVRQFQNVDSITGEPIPGVANEIKRSSVDGQDYQSEEISNRNGIFYVKAIEGDRLDINSTHRYYEPKQTNIARFSEGEIIKMMPKKTSLTFRTVSAADWSLLPDCGLTITNSRGQPLRPANSGDGEFTVDGLYYGDNISITASKSGFSTNSTTIDNDKVSMLMNAPQRRRDIPLNVDLPPCNGGESGENNVNAGHVSAPQSFNMGADSGSFEFDYYTGNACPDQIDVYNHKPGEPFSSSNKIWSSGMIITGDTHQKTRISFNRGSVITVVVTTGPENGSAWSYHVSCPD